MARLGRILYFTTLALLWLAAGVLIIEGAERVRRLYSEHYYAAYFQEQTAKVYRMTPAQGALMEKERSRSFGTPPPVPPRQECAPETPEREAGRNAFASRGTHERATMATVRGEMTAIITTKLELLELWGDPLFKRSVMESLRQGIPSMLHPSMADLLEGGDEPAALHAERLVLSPGTPCEATAHRFRHFDGNGFHTRIELKYRQLQPVMLPPEPPLGAEASTEIVSFSYKRNWRLPNQIATYNNYGFRDDDVVMPKPEGTFRIVCIGGSTTEEGNSNALTYPNIVERKLREEFGGRVEVINCGISGIDSYLERRRIEDYLELQPDLLVYYNAVNDLSKEHFNVWLPMVQGWPRKLLWSAALSRWYNRLLLPPDEVVEEYMWNHTFVNIRAMAWRARECGVPFAVCSFATPAWEKLDYRDRVYLDINLREVWYGEYLTYATFLEVIGIHNRLARRLCELDKLDYIPVAEELQEGMDYFLDTCHMTPPGLELKTDIISRHLSRIITPRLR